MVHLTTWLEAHLMKLHSLCLALLLASASAGHAQDSANVEVLEIVTNIDQYHTYQNYYFVIGDSVFHGEVIDDGLWFCDTILYPPYTLDESVSEIDLLKRRLGKIPFRALQLGIEEMDKNTVWRLVSAKITFVVSPCTKKNYDQFQFLYNPEVGVNLLAVIPKSIKKIKEMPPKLSLHIKKRYHSQKR